MKVNAKWPALLELQMGVCFLYFILFEKANKRFFIRKGLEFLNFQFYIKNKKNLNMKLYKKTRMRGWFG